MQEITKDNTAGVADPKYCPADDAAKVVGSDRNSGTIATVCGLSRIAFTRTEAARMLGVTPITVDRLTKRGLLRPNRSTRRPLYPHAELERFLRV